MVPAVGGTTHDLTLADVEAVRRRVRQVRYLAPIGIGTAPVKWGGRSRDAMVFGTTWEMQPVRRFRVATGGYLPAGEAERAESVCVLGSKIRTELFGAANPVGEMLRIGDERYRVIGVMAPRGPRPRLRLRRGGPHPDRAEHEDVQPAVDLPDARRDRVARGDPRRRRTPSSRVLKERHDGEEDVTVLTQDAVVSTFGKILDALTAALAGIAAISLSVAGILIMNVMLVSVSERTREIGLLKAVGAGRPQILAVFLAEAAMLSTSGGVAGLLAGLGAARLFSAIYPDFPVSPPAWAVAAALAVSVGVGLLFGALPARRASRLDPVAALSRR